MRLTNKHDKEHLLIIFFLLPCLQRYNTFEPVSLLGCGSSYCERVPIAIKLESLKVAVVVVYSL